MSLNINVQGIVDARVAQLSKSDEQRQLEGNIYQDLAGEFLDNTAERIMRYSDNVQALKAKDNGPTIHKAAIAFFERQIAILSGVSK